MHLSRPVSRRRRRVRSRLVLRKVRIVSGREAPSFFGRSVSPSANTQGEIRVGPSHQVRLPECKPNVPPEDMPESCDGFEDLLWLPGVADCDLMMYLRAARSMAAFAGMCDGGSADDGCLAACRDDTTINAMDILHNSGYDTGRALQALVKNPVPRRIEKKWADDEQKRFVKGLRQYGKNFFRIRKDLLPQKETGDLVEFYYLWKKTPSAATNRPHRRHRRQTVLRRIRGTARVTRPQSNECADMSSVSEEENESDDSDSRDVNGYSCCHCYVTNSKEWHPTGKERSVLCTECCNFYKKYGELRPLPENRESPNFFFKPVKDEDSSQSEGKTGMRTRRSKEGVSEGKSGSKNQSSRTATPENVDSPVSTGGGIGLQIGKGRKSPSTWSTCSTSSTDRLDSGNKKTELEALINMRKRCNEERTSETDADEEVQTKKKKSQDRSESPTESVMSESGSATNEENGHDGDNEQDGLSFPSSPSIRSPSPTDSEAATVKNKVQVDETSPSVITIQQQQQPLPVSVPVPPTQQPIMPTLPPPPIPPPLPPPPPPLSPPPPPSQQPIVHAVLPSMPTFSELQYRDELLLPDTISNRPVVKPSPPAPISQPVPPVMVVVPPDVAKPEELPIPLNHSSFPQPIPPPMNIVPPSHTMPLSPDSTSPPPVSNPHLSSHSNLSIPQQPQGPPHLPPHMQPPLQHQHQQQPPPTHHRIPSPGPYMKHHSMIPGMAHCPPHMLPHHGIMYPPPPSMQRPPPHQSPHHMASPLGFNPMDPPPAHSMSMHSLPHQHIHPYMHQRPIPIPEVQVPPSPRPPSSGRGSPIIGMQSMSVSVPPLHSSQRGSGGPPPLIEIPHQEHEIEAEEDDEPPVPTRGPSPDPRVEDSECHRSQSAIFLRHWNRGDCNSCCRTDLTFKPVPDSKLARKREERLRKQAEKEREEREKAAAKAMATSESKQSQDMKGNGSQQMGLESPMHHGSPYERCTPRGYANHDTPALRQLSEYARPHTAFSPNMARSLPAGIPMPPHGMDPMIHYQLSAGLYQPGARERLEFELEREKREQEMRERELQNRVLHDKLKELEMKPGLGRLPPGAGPLENHWLDMHRRYAGIPGGPAAAMAGIPQFALYAAAGQPGGGLLDRERLERMGMAPHMVQVDGAYAGSVERLSAERLHAERMALATDPMLRLQMAGHDMPPGMGHPQGHVGNPNGPVDPHHLLQAGGYPRGALIHRESGQLLHPSGLLSRQYEEQLAHQLSAHAAHEQLQRQMMMERERYASQGPQLHPSLLAQHEEYLRQQQQREREMKIRTLEEAARGGRSYDHLPPGDKR